jgi:hypothetical protein
MAAERRQRGTGRTGEHSGDDGAPEHEREKLTAGEIAGSRRVSLEQTTSPAQSAAAQAERQQERDLASGEENPG